MSEPHLDPGECPPITTALIEWLEAVTPKPEITPRANVDEAFRSKYAEMWGARELVELLRNHHDIQRMNDDGIYTFPTQDPPDATAN